MKYKYREMIAFCGLLCDKCPIHLATTEKDEPLRLRMRESIAEECRVHYEMNFQPGDINDCDGCGSVTGRLFSGCTNCGIRKCAIMRNVENCAYCKDYPCDRLMEHFLLDPGAQSRLKEIRRVFSYQKSIKFKK